MYCPKCAAMNAEDSKFCRLCGQDLSLVSDAISGRLPVSIDREKSRRERRRDRKDKPPTLQSGIVHVFIGLGFLVASLGLLLSGQSWWWVFLFPGFPNLGRGVAAIVGALQAQSAANQLYAPRAPQPPVITSAPRTGELYDDPSRQMNPPPSVTEGTTRIMNRNPELGEKV